jgi:hypothetical protein
VFVGGDWSCFEVCFRLISNLVFSGTLLNYGVFVNLHLKIASDRFVEFSKVTKPVWSKSAIPGSVYSGGKFNLFYAHFIVFCPSSIENLHFYSRFNGFSFEIGRLACSSMILRCCARVFFK